MRVRGSPTTPFARRAKYLSTHAYDKLNKYRKLFFALKEGGEVAGAGGITITGDSGIGAFIRSDKGRRERNTSPVEPHVGHWRIASAEGEDTGGVKLVFTRKIEHTSFTLPSMKSHSLNFAFCSSFQPRERAHSSRTSPERGGCFLKVGRSRITSRDVVSRFRIFVFTPSSRPQE